jgi:LysR family transcriptional regulator (chromosome initiation inhibitor)
VMGAVTTERTPVSGCRADPLGVMRYVPVAGPAYAEHFSGGFTADSVASAPSLAWNRDDALQDMLVRKAFNRDVRRPVHYVPTAEGFAAAVRAGLGWGMYPEQSADTGIARGDFTRISSQHLDVPLYWQCWRLDSPTARRVTDAVQMASAGLRRR